MMLEGTSEVAPPLLSPTRTARELGATICAELGSAHRVSFGQFLTPPRIASLIAQLFADTDENVRLLDPGAGVGALSAAFVESMLNRQKRPRSISLVAWETEKSFIPALRTVLQECVAMAAVAKIPVEFTIHEGDFLRDALEFIGESTLFENGKLEPFTHAILNPPYRKINSNSAARIFIRKSGLETSNLYTGFLWVAASLLAAEGQMVAINPRSFCNGPYFLPFRKKFFDEMALEHIHLFNRRDVVFSGDDVLQENLILSARRTRSKKEFILLSNSDGNINGNLDTRHVPHSQVFNPKDPSRVLHLALDLNDDAVKERVNALPARLNDLGIGVSTGRVVDFRARDYLRKDPERGTVPLIYPTHFNGGGIHWPRAGAKKPNALITSPETEDLLVANGIYVLVKRFTSKEEKKRVVARIFFPTGELASFAAIGFENHLNYFYGLRKPLDEDLAKGLSTYLNSTLVDSYFRQFSGHTQVNATDLRSLHYPSVEKLRTLGRMSNGSVFDQDAIDRAVDTTL